MNNKEVALKAAAVLLNKKAMDVVVIDIAEKSSFADYFVIASGGSERQVGTLADEVEDQFAKEGILTKSVEGKKTSGWILMDFGDVIVNIFTVEQRDRYHIEKVWSDCTFLEINENELQ
ncbi:ribosome silencing factor [Anoxybacterium hadale]|uniref:Ribosome silencing factor n=1 Tax=Anoxybacterium hadale TaxID=3408580 RepID=A0ACD1A8L1_9FIRM|nr:ribosome silencing factor [Clostridiales bacterium]